MSTAFRASCAVLAVSLLTVPLLAQTPASDRLEQIKRLNKVAAQKTEADIRDAVKEAAALIKTDPSAALEVLEAAGSRRAAGSRGQSGTHNPPKARRRRRGPGPCASTSRRRRAAAAAPR